MSTKKEDIDVFKTKRDLSEGLDRIHRELGHGSRGNVYTELLGGFNHRSPGSSVLNNKDHQGYTFFTRPCLNLTYSNLSRDRAFLPYRDAEYESPLRAARVYLDPWSQHISGRIQPDKFLTSRPNYVAGENKPYVPGQDGLVSSMHVDPLSPFINVLSNTLLSLSGWPDPVMDYWSSDAGRMGEQTIMAQGNYNRLGSFELQGTFRNIEGNFLPLLFGLWLPYMTNVLINKMIPYVPFIAKRMYDYNTRIYRFVMDPTKRYITMWCATGASFPVNNPLSQIFNYDADKIYSDGTATLSYSFQSVGAMYNDPILLEEFNRCVIAFNPGLEIEQRHGVNVYEGGDTVLKNKTKYRKLRPVEMMLFNKVKGCYPLINLETKELEWWVDVDVYKAMIQTPSKDRKDPRNRQQVEGA